MTFNEKLVSLDIRLRELRKGLEDDLARYRVKGWLSKEKIK